jgi:NADPH-dependent 2,4-dienoyl-CoA reductase/sulfur reductase-like enzyme
MISRIISILLLITCTNAFFDLDFYNFLPSQTTDVLVIGSGAAGLAAANSALLRGL